MSDNRGQRNFGMGKKLSKHTCRILAKEVSRSVNRGSTLENKIYTALNSHLAPILLDFGITDLYRMESHHKIAVIDYFLEKLTEGVWILPQYPH